MHPSNIMRSHKSGESAQESGNKYNSPSFLPVVLHARREDCLPLMWQLFGMRFVFLKIINVIISNRWQKYSNLYYMLHAKLSLITILPTVRYEASLFKGTFYYNLGSTQVEGGILVSSCPSVRLWTESCPLCIFYNTRWVNLIFAHLIKQLQKVCRM